MSKLNQAFLLIDKLNSLDPRKERDERGIFMPKELLYGFRMTNMLSLYYPSASQALQLSARAQHIERWVIPRESYAKGRIGYLQWRRALYDYHAKKAQAIACEVGYDQEVVIQIGMLLKKKGLKKNKEVQILEDVACFVFLQYYAFEFAKKHPKEKVSSIVQKTRKKMSEEAKQTIYRYVDEEVGFF